MSRPVIAIVTGFTKSRLLLEHSMASLRALRRKGVIDHIYYVTWDKPELDAILAPITAMPEIELVRVPEPQVDSPVRYHKSFACQSRGLVAGLERVADPEALILKMRPDFVASEEFLAAKLLSFDFWSPTGATSYLDVEMPPSPFEARIWTPWAEACMPFFFEDGAMIGKRADIAKLVSNEAGALLRPHGTEDAQWIIHILRFIMPFLQDYPIFRRLIDEIDIFPQLYDYRFKTVELQIEQAFFWHLAVANAWVLHTSFHIDCGYVGQLKFYPNQFQEQKLHKPVEQFASLDEMELYPPYGTVENWRVSQDPGGMLPCIGRAYGRLVDDNWPRSLFAGKPLRDLPLENMQIVLRNIAQYRTGVLRELENQYYAAVAEGYRTHWLNRAA